MKRKVHTERWGSASELTISSSLVLFQVICPGCGKKFEPGEWVRTRYGPHRGTTYHDDCVEAVEGDEDEVTCVNPNCSGS